jgi:hypothetical protein
MDTKLMQYLQIKKLFWEKEKNKKNEDFELDRIEWAALIWGKMDGKVMKRKE